MALEPRLNRGLRSAWVLCTQHQVKPTGTSATGYELSVYGLHRDPHVRRSARIHAAKSRFRNADHSERHLLVLDDLSGYGRIGSKPPRPKRVTEYNHRLGGLIVSGFEKTAGQGRDSEGGKVLA